MLECNQKLLFDKERVVIRPLQNLGNWEHNKRK